MFQCGIIACTEGDVKLVNITNLFNNAFTGTVQVCIDKQYRYVCADGWDNREADVVCRTLSFSYRAPYGMYNPHCQLQYA